VLGDLVVDPGDLAGDDLRRGRRPPARRGCAGCFSALAIRSRARVSSWGSSSATSRAACCARRVSRAGGDVAQARGGERGLEVGEDLVAVGAGRALSFLRRAVGLDPLGGDGEDLVVEAGGAGAVEREAAEDEELGLGVVGAADAGAAELVVHEALGEEAAEQALDDAVLEVEVHDLAVEVAGVAEDDGADGGVAAPLAEGLVFLRGARRASRVAAQLGSAPARRWRAGRRQRARAGSTRAAASSRGEGLGAEQAEGGGEGAAEVVVAEAEPVREVGEQAAQLGDAELEVVLALADLLELALDLEVEEGLAARLDGRRSRR
jgi:hypothetical protein